MFGVQIKRYHAERCLLPNKLFQEAVEESKQTINFCGNGSYLQISIAERKIKMMMLVNRTFILLTKLYFTKGFRTKVCPYTLKAPAKQPNNLKVENKRITSRKTFAGIITYINLKRQHV